MPQSWRFRKSRMQRGERAGHGRSGLSERECACWGLAVLGGLRRPVQGPRGAENSERNLYALARSRMWRRAPGGCQAPGRHHNDKPEDILPDGCVGAARIRKRRRKAGGRNGGIGRQSRHGRAEGSHRRVHSECRMGQPLFASIYGSERIDQGRSPTHTSFRRLRRVVYKPTLSTSAGQGNIVSCWRLDLRQDAKKTPSSRNKNDHSSKRRRGPSMGSGVHLRVAS